MECIKCISCNIDKSKDEFHKNKRRPSGVSSYCKECTNIKSKIAYNNTISRKQVTTYKVRKIKIRDGYHAIFEKFEITDKNKMQEYMDCYTISELLQGSGLGKDYRPAELFCRRNLF